MIAFMLDGKTGFISCVIHGQQEAQDMCEIVNVINGVYDEDYK